MSGLAPPSARRARLGTISLVAAAAAALLGAALLERHLPRRGPLAPSVAAQAAAAEARMARAAAVLSRAKEAAGVPRPEGVAAAEAGLVGAELTPLVTTLGSLEAKRLAASPRWAAELVVRLRAQGLSRGDAVAASFSGSFPGLDLAVVSACAEVGLDLAAVSSVTASTWGATEPGFTWPEMEARLVAATLVPRASVAVSAGGDGDAARDLEDGPRLLARRIAREAAAALGAELLVPPTLSASVERRLALARRHAAGRPLALYVNCGGNEASLGRSAAFLRMRSGFLRGLPFDLGPDAGVMARLAAEGVPVLHLLNVEELALRWGVTGPGAGARRPG